MDNIIDHLMGKGSRIPAPTARASVSRVNRKSDYLQKVCSDCLRGTLGDGSDSRRVSDEDGDGI